MAIYDQTDKDREERQRIDQYNEALHNKIKQRSIERTEILTDFFYKSNNKDVEMLKKHLITDSRGQHKDQVSRARLEDVEDAVIIPEKRKEIPPIDDDEDYEIIEETRDFY